MGILGHLYGNQRGYLRSLLWGRPHGRVPMVDNSDNHYRRGNRLGNAEIHSHEIITRFQRDGVIPGERCEVLGAFFAQGMGVWLDREKMAYEEGGTLIRRLSLR